MNMVEIINEDISQVPNIKRFLDTFLLINCCKLLVNNMRVKFQQYSKTVLGELVLKLINNEQTKMDIRTKSQISSEKQLK